MTGRASKIRKYMLHFQKICNLGENCDFIEKKIGKKFFSCDFLKFLMVSLDAQQDFMPLKYNFFFLSLLDQKL